MDIATFTDWSVWLASGVGRAAVLTLPVFLLAVAVTGLGAPMAGPLGPLVDLVPGAGPSIDAGQHRHSAQPATISRKRLVGSDGKRLTRRSRASNGYGIWKSGRLRKGLATWFLLEAISPDGSISAAPTADDVRLADAARIALAALLAGVAIMGLLDSDHDGPAPASGSGARRMPSRGLAADAGPRAGSGSGSLASSSCGPYRGWGVRRPADGCNRRSFSRRTCSIGPRPRCDTFSGTNSAHIRRRDVATSGILRGADPPLVEPRVLVDTAMLAP